MTNREKVLRLAATKLRDALTEAAAEGDILEAISLGGNHLEKLTDAELTVLIDALHTEQCSRQGLM